MYCSAMPVGPNNQSCTRKTKLHGYVPTLWFNYFILGLNFIFFVSGYGNV